MSQRETLAFYSQFDSFEDWHALLSPLLPGVEILPSDQIDDPASVRYTMVWKPPQDFFAQYPNLQLVVNLGAGVDSLVSRTDLPDVPITRLSDPDMGRMMASYVLFAVLRYVRDIPELEKAQRERRWHYVHPRHPASVRVGVLGLGELGACVAHELVRQGYDVRGWSRSPKSLDGVTCTSGMEALPGFLAECDILSVMLPLTPETRGLLNAERLAMLPKGAKFINSGRGPVVDQKALTDALISGHLGGATLDVFDPEPLSPDDPLWGLENVLITPHVASVALPTSAAEQIALNIGRIRRGEPVEHRVDPARGY